MSKQLIHSVGEIMTGDLVALGPLDSMGQARTILMESGLHAVPVIEQDKACGMVTLADCGGRQPGELLRDVMKTPALTVDVTATIAEAATLMRREYVHHLLVTEGGTRSVVGMLSSHDLLVMLEPEE